MYLNNAHTHTCNRLSVRIACDPEWLEAFLRHCEVPKNRFGGTRTLRSCGAWSKSEGSHWRCWPLSAAIWLKCGGFHGFPLSWGYLKMVGLFHGKSPSKMDERRTLDLLDWHRRLRRHDRVATCHLSRIKRLGVWCPLRNHYPGNQVQNQKTTQ